MRLVSAAASSAAAGRVSAEPGSGIDRDGTVVSTSSTRGDGTDRDGTDRDGTDRDGTDRAVDRALAEHPRSDVEHGGLPGGDSGEGLPGGDLQLGGALGGPFC